MKVLVKILIFFLIMGFIRGHGIHRKKKP